MPLPLTRIMFSYNFSCSRERVSENMFLELGGRPSVGLDGCRFCGKSRSAQVDSYGVITLRYLKCGKKS